MPGFDRDEFWLKVLSYYQTARENNYLVKLNEEQTKELKALYIEQYIPTEKLSHYDDEKLIKKMMTAIVSIYKLDKDIASNYGEVVELVNSVDYDGKCLYLHCAKISEVKLRRFQLGRSQKHRQIQAVLLPGDISGIAQDRGLSLRLGHGFELL